MRWLRRADEWMHRVVLAVAVAMFVVMGVSVFAQVICRYFLSKGLSWVDELTRYLLVWTVFLGGCSALGELEQTSVSIVKDRLPKSVAKVIRIAFDVSIIVFLCVLVRTGYHFAKLGQLSKTLALGGITQFWPFMAIPIGSVFMIFSYVVKVLGEFFPPSGGNGGDGA